MFYRFEAASHIDDYLAAIAGCDEFVVKRDTAAGLITINYNYVSDTTFPDPMALTGADRRLAILRRDCRGIEFDLETGDVVTKKFHKFYNVNERPETQVSAIDWSQPHHVLDKLDGSLITAFRLKDGTYRWHTKMGATDVAAPVNRFVAASRFGYVALVAALYGAHTPIFEWCSLQQRIVIAYPQERLVLTAVRDNHAGTYASYSQLQAYGLQFDVPVVASVADSVGEIDQFLLATAALQDVEGYVVRFADGHAVKVKGEWYQRIHRTKELITREKNVWDLLLHNGLDDAKPFMQEADRVLIEAFAAEFYRRLQVTTDRLVNKVALDRLRFDDKRDFARFGVLTAPPQERGLLFRIWDGHDAWSETTAFLAKNVGTQAKVDSVRSFVGGLVWHQHSATEPQ